MVSGKTDIGWLTIFRDETDNVHGTGTKLKYIDGIIDKIDRYSLSYRFVCYKSGGYGK